jgi:hypothetical protein
MDCGTLMIVMMIDSYSSGELKNYDEFSTLPDVFAEVRAQSITL